MISFKIDDLKNMHAELKTFADFLRGGGASDDDIFLSKLVSCELITNVIRHGGDEAQFTAIMSGGDIVITVAADSLKNLELKAGLPDVFSESGRGLYIVKSICSAFERGDDGEIRVIIERHL